MPFEHRSDYVAEELKIHRGQPDAGSSPALGTNVLRVNAPRSNRWLDLRHLLTVAGFAQNMVGDGVKRQSDRREFGRADHAAAGRCSADGGDYLITAPDQALDSGFIFVLALQEQIRGRYGQSGDKLGSMAKSLQ